MIIKQTLSFHKSLKKLHLQQKHTLDQAIQIIQQNPFVGVSKKGDLSKVRVYKFRLNTVLTLLAYTCEPEIETITLLKLGSHENFSQELKMQNH